MYQNIIYISMNKNVHSRGLDVIIIPLYRPLSDKCSYIFVLPKFDKHFK